MKPGPLTCDIKRILNFELQHGNEVLGFGAGDGYTLIELRDPFHFNDSEFAQAVSETTQSWRWGSQHYEEEFEGFRSTIFPHDAVVVRIRKTRVP